jgi:CHAT domain-containing protein
VVQGLSSRSEVHKRFEFLRFHLSRLASDPASAKARPALALLNMQDHLQKLYEMLVRPLEPFLAGRESIVFVPVDFMHYVPLHALFDGTCYLMDRFAISYAPTATVYQLFKAKHVEEAGSTPLLVGIPDDKAPFIADEIESIQSVLPAARALVGPRATQANITREMQTASLIHIASHATFRPDNPMFSSIQLHDVPLNFFDIYTLRTPARLVTLSGCGTGLSSVVAGDELLGLVRGFLYAGATSLVTSLWDVNDYTTGDLMKYFYGYLAEGDSKSQSLRKAMVRLREEHPHPYYWAPFLLMGDPS